MQQKTNPLIIFVAVLASLLEIIDSSIVNVALPTMMGNLGATLEDISMVVTGYAIANAVVLPASAWLGTRFGRRPYYLGCIAFFTLTSVACGFAPNLTTLIIFRIFQGLAGGALLPTSQTLIYEQFPKEKAGMAGAIFGMSVMIGPTLGPVLGGYLTDTLGWRSIFNVNLPLGILALVLGMICIHNPSYETAKEGEKVEKPGFDGFGLALLVIGIGALQFVLERGEADDWFDSRLITTMAMIATVCLPTFVWWELRVKHPIINVRLFKENVVANGVLLMVSLGFFLYAVVFILPIFVNRVFHYDATQTGSLFIPGALLTAMMMPFIGRALQGGMNPKLMIGIGFVAIEICCYFMTKFSPVTARGDLLNALYIRGFAMAFLFVPINSSILSQFKGAALGQVSGLLNLFRQLGGSAGIALVATLLTSLSQQNYLDLSSKVSLLNSNTQVAFYQTKNSLAKQMSENVGMAANQDTATNAALTALKGRVMNQVFMNSFLQLLWIVMLTFLFAFIPLFLIRFEKRGPPVLDAH
jgi:DHA2 family multidrug resistance protein